MIIIFKWLYTVLIADIFLIGQIPVFGGINLLQITIILMLLVCYSIEKKILFDKWLKWYLCFVVFYLISAVFTGYESGFLRFLSSQLVGCYTLYYCTYVLLKQKVSLNYLLYPLVIIGIIDSIVTICQAYGFPIQNPLLKYFVIDIEQEDLLSSNQNLLGLSISGLYSNPVYNGHYLLVFCISSLFLLFSNKKKIQFIGIISSTFILIGLFFCQQRSGFFISLTTWLFLIYRYISKKIRNQFLTIIVLSIGFLYTISHLMGFLESSDSRLISESDSGREMLLMGSIDYYLQHPILGGYAACVHLLGRPSHNLFVSAFLAGGLLGGTTLICFIIKLIVIALKQVTRNNIISPISLLFIGLVADSLFHNTGFVEGEPATFLALVLLVYTQKVRKELL